MGVGEFDTKVAVVVRDDLATWQRLNVTAFLMSGIVARAGAGAIGEDYLDADGRHYLPLLVQPVLVFEAAATKLKTVRERAERRGVPLAVYTREMFATGNDADNRAAVRAVPTDQLDLVASRCVPRTETPTRSCAAWTATPEPPRTIGPCRRLGPSALRAPPTEPPTPRRSRARSGSTR
jgi:hypothetical protein